MRGLGDTGATADTPPTSGRGSSVVAARVRAPTISALPRQRLDIALAELWQHRLGLVVAPAGSGKTTLCVQFAARAGVPVAWYRAESWDTEVDVFLRYIEAALTSAIPELRGGWTGIEDAVAALEEHGGRVLLVIDDLHTLRGTSAEDALGRLLDYAPRGLVVLGASRSQPAINLSRLRVEGALLELGVEDLRFRLWEVERLFRDHYGLTRPPEELAELARRTEGWAAGLQLFHLATEGRGPAERRDLLTSLGHRNRLIRDYLTRNVLDHLPPELREFLVLSSPLGRLTGALCDALLERSGSLALLEDLERRQVFTSVTEVDGSYRYHEVLRAHLDQVLVDLLGDVGARAQHRRAAELLEAEAPEEALRAWSRAEDWSAVERVLARSGRLLAGGTSRWIDALPAAVLQTDPWLALATARRLRAEGRWEDAAAAYRRAESGAGATEVAELGRLERQAVEAWLAPGTPRPSGALGALRSAVEADPARVAAAAAAETGAQWRAVEAIAHLLAGDVGRVATSIDVDLGEEEESDVSALDLADLVRGTAGLIAADVRAAQHVSAAVEAAERSGQTWLARVGRAIADLGDGVADSAPGELLLGARRARDPWGEAVAALCLGLAALDGRRAPVPGLRDAARRVAAVGGAVPALWLEVLGALGGDADINVADLEAAAQSLGVPGAVRAARLARAVRDGDEEGMDGACAALDEVGLVILSRTLADRSPAAPAPASAVHPNGRGAAQGSRQSASPGTAVPAVVVSTFGGLRITVGGSPLDLGQVRPRVRALLRRIVAEGGRPVHREILLDALWPGADQDTGLRNLHTALSSLRGVLEPAIPGAIVREGDAYRLATVSGLRVDVRDVEESLTGARRDLGRGDVVSARTRLEAALRLVDGELLPEEGPAEWAVTLRDRLRLQITEVARMVAERLIEGDASAAADVAAAGLRVDRLADPLWRLAIGAHERAGDVGAAARARRSYAQTLAHMNEPV